MVLRNSPYHDNKREKDWKNRKKKRGSLTDYSLISLFSHYEAVKKTFEFPFFSKFLRSR